MAAPRQPAHPRLPARCRCQGIKHLLNGKLKWFDQFATNTKIAECCRDMNAHDIEAWYSSPEDRDKGMPDIYKIFCSCGRCHDKFCVGGNHPDAKLYSKDGTTRPL